MDQSLTSKRVPHGARARMLAILSVQRIRIHFSKDGAMRFTGNLDLMRAWERLLRRVELPVAYSKGYSPHPRLNLAAALPLGFTSDCEVIDIWLEETVPPDEIMARLLPAAPSGLTVHAVRPVELEEKSPQALLVSTEYQVMLEPRPELAERLEELMAAPTLPRERRGKSYDLRPLVERIWLDEKGIRMRLAARPGKTGRPDEVLLALGLDPLALQIHRTQLFFQDP